ncbi:hypothetical protein C0992_005231 [Termitomyces sp. T32_za158]|nr:hypothetical protein C0992_005231 [Termitomyces sp. T32_za158]
MPSHAPTPPSPGNDNVAAWSVYEDWQQEYEHRCNARHVWELAHAHVFLPFSLFLLLIGLPPEVLWATQIVAPGTGPESVATVPLVSGQILVVPQSERVAMEDASPDAVDRALQWPRGPPTQEWCQANSPCFHSWRFYVRGVSLQAQAVFNFAAVEGEMGEKTEICIGEPQLAGTEGSSSALVVSMGLYVDKGKRKAAPALGPTRRVCHCAFPVCPVAEAGPLGLHVFLSVLEYPLPSLRVPQVQLEEAQAEAAQWRLEAEELRQEQVWG